MVEGVETSSFSFCLELPTAGVTETVDTVAVKYG